jgi:hypothetical protein
VSNKRVDLTRRKQALIAQAAHERAELAEVYDKLRSILDLNRAVLGLGRVLKSHPIVTAGVSSVLVSGFAGKLLRGAGQIIALSRMALPLWSWWAKRKP